LANSTIADKRFMLIFGAWWLSWAILHYNVLSNYGLSNAEAIADSFTSNLLLAGCCLLISNNMRYYLPRQEKYWYVLAISFGLSSVWMLLTRFLLWLFFRDDMLYLGML
jgi:two-component system, LytTR family, sensor kinase